MSKQDDKPDEGLSTEQAIALHKGGVFEDGPFELSHNDDGRGHYYLRQYGEVHDWSYSFSRVERTGEDQFNLADEQRAGFYLNNIENYPLLRKALLTIARVTPNKPPKDR